MSYKLVRLPVIIIILVLISFTCYTGIKKTYASAEITNKGHLTISKDEENYIDNIRIKDLSIQKCQMSLSDEDIEGYQFVLTYTNPNGANIDTDLNVGLQIEYPAEYYSAIGCNMTAVSYFHPTGINQQSQQTFVFDAYSENVSEKLINAQYSFKINIYLNQQIIKELYIQNSFTSS